MKTINRSDNLFGISEAHDHPMRELLPEYATSAALGRTPQHDYPQVARHLKICAACRAELAELQQLTTDMYAGRIAPAAHYPAANLSFLSGSAAPVRPWAVDTLGRLIVIFSHQLIEALRAPALAGGLRGQSIWRYIQEPGSVDDLEVEIEAFVEDEARGLGLVRVDVSIPSRDPFKQGGSQVTLHADGEIWQDETSDLGSVDFTQFPLASLPRLRVEIAPQRAERSPAHSSST